MANAPKDPEKTVDMPPYGSRNPDPITDTPGSHPIETGVGAALGGAASGAAVGLVAGPVGAAIGAAVGAIAGGYAGKGIGELIDPTTEDNWLRESFNDKSYIKKGDTYDRYEPAYKYAGHAHNRHAGKPFSEVETDLHADWDKSPTAKDLQWEHARPAIEDAYDRTAYLHEQRMRASSGGAMGAPRPGI